MIWTSVFEHVIFVVILASSFIASYLTDFHLLRFPSIHIRRPNESNMCSHVSVFGRAIKAYEYPNGAGSPFWILRFTVKADLKPFIPHNLPYSRGLLVVC